MPRGYRTRRINAGLPTGPHECEKCRQGRRFRNKPKAMPGLLGTSDACHPVRLDEVDAGQMRQQGKSERGIIGIGAPIMDATGALATKDR